MIRGQLLRLWIKQTVHAGIAKVPHNVNVWEHTMSDVVLSQNVGLSEFLSCYSRPGQMKAVPCKKLLVLLQCPPKSPCYLCFFHYPGLPSQLKSPNNGELSALEEIYASQEHRNRSCVDWEGPAVLHTACVSWACAGKEVRDLEKDNKRSAYRIAKLRCLGGCQCFTCRFPRYQHFIKIFIALFKIIPVAAFL